MKKFLFIAAVIFMATSVCSCSKDEFEKDNTDKADVKLVRQIRATYDYPPIGKLRTIDLEYDSQNRIVRYYEYYEDSFNWHHELNFIYDGDSMIANFDDGEEVYNCKLNKDGYITEWVYEDDDHYEKEKFTYKNGYMIYSDYIFGSSSGFLQYNWEDGNITSILENDYYDYFSYSPYKHPHINLDLFYITDDYGCYGDTFGLLGFYGRHNDYLPSINYWKNGSRNYVYEFNEDGTVSKIILGMIYMELYY